MKVVLLASGPFAVPALDLLHAGGSSFELCGVVCRPARPAGRGRKTRENPVKARAQELGITCLTPPTVNAPEFCEELQLEEANAELRELKNVVLLPHMGSATREGRAEMGEKVIINIKTFADGHRPPDQIVPGML